MTAAGSIRGVMGAGGIESGSGGDGGGGGRTVVGSAPGTTAILPLDEMLRRTAVTLDGGRDDLVRGRLGLAPARA